MIYVILVIVALAALVAFVLWRKKRGPSDPYGFKVPPPPRYAYRTQAGAEVRSQRPLANPSALDAIDRGLRQFFDSTAEAGWPLRRAAADYSIWLLEPTSASDPEGYPTLNMIDGQKIAGIAIGVTPPFLDRPLIIGACNDQFLDYLTAVVRHEAEHVGAFGNVDAAEWARNTAPGHYHPLYELPAESELARRTRQCGVGC